MQCFLILVIQLLPYKSTLYIWNIGKIASWLKEMALEIGMFLNVSPVSLFRASKNRPLTTSMDQGLRTWYTPGKESGENCQCWAEVGGVKNEEKNVVAMVSWTVVELGSWRICSSFFC